MTEGSQPQQILPTLISRRTFRAFLATFPSLRTSGAPTDQKRQQALQIFFWQHFFVVGRHDPFPRLLPRFQPCLIEAMQFLSMVHELDRTPILAQPCPSIFVAI